MMTPSKYYIPFPEFRMLRLTENGESAVVDFDWPSPLGSINETFLTNFEKLIDYLEDNSPSTVVVFRGLAGEIPDWTSLPNIDHCRRWEKILAQISRLPFITIAAVDGICLGFCLQLALSCDFRLATEGSAFVSPEIKQGYLPGMMTFRLAKFVGIGVARQILFTGLHFKAKQAKKSGLLDIMCASNQLDQAINNLIEQVTPVNRTAVQLGRRLLNESFASTYEEAIGHFLAAQHNCLGQPNRN